MLSAISFRLPSDSFPTVASSDSPLSSAYAFDFSRPSSLRFASFAFNFLSSAVFRFLSLASVLDSDYSASVSDFPTSSCLRLTVASSVLALFFRFKRLPRYLMPDFSCIPSRFWYSHLLFVSFCPSLIRSHSCSSGACFQISLSTLSISLLLSFVRFSSTSGYSAFCFFLSVLLVSASQRLSRCILSTLVSRISPLPSA